VSLPPQGSSRLELLDHLLSLVGVRGIGFAGRLLMLDSPSAVEPSVLEHAVRGGVVVALRPMPGFCAALGVVVQPRPHGGAGVFAHVPVRGVARKLKTWGDDMRFAGPGEAVVTDNEGACAWRHVGRGRGGFLLVGTDLAGDLLRLRQGDPCMAAGRQQDPMWDVAGERPVYLFERQLDGLSREDQRQADFWAVLAADCIASCAGVALEPVLPEAAPGAVVITGDDDQAYLEKYEQQQALLRGAPITYFLHPLTRHSSATLRTLCQRAPVDLGIHPDAIDAPSDYPRLLHEQCKWFRQLTGTQPMSLRNHGFLNDGYWGHLRPWLHEGVRISSNLPGLDGRALNGSLLPARVWMDGVLTPHWSIVTAIGDGIRYVDGGRPDAQAANCVYDLADAIRRSRIPGVLVLNLHPQNVEDTRLMHQAALEVVRSGFLAWNMRDCVDWFENGKVSRRQGGFLANAWRGARRLWTAQGQA
jgi:hypothetical protein